MAGNENRPVIGITCDAEGHRLVLGQEYCEAVEVCGGVPVVVPALHDPGPVAGVIHGLLIPGGDDVDPSYYHETTSPEVRPVPRRRTDFEMGLISRMMNLGKPVLGICYGMQLINVFFGGALHQDLGQSGIRHASQTGNFHEIVITENRFLKRGTFTVNSTHHQAVKKLGSGLSAFVFSRDQVIEALCKEDYNFLMGVQWHPERLLESELSRSIFESFIRASREQR